MIDEGNFSPTNFDTDQSAPYLECHCEEVTTYRQMDLGPSDRPQLVANALA
jgi:hypothetical protein